MSLISQKNAFEAYVYRLQDRICKGLESCDGMATFKEDDWERNGGGGGRTRVLEKGQVFEKAGVNCSSVHGELPEAIKKHFNVSEGRFFATGISLVLHPENPHVPTVHFNVRYFELYNATGEELRDAWFGGGMDLTPYVLYNEDARHFHQVNKAACDAHHPDFYAQYKAECDRYFHNAHRGEARGVGGVFFDYLRQTDAFSLQQRYNFVTSVGDCFLDAYVPIVERRKSTSFTEEQRYFQELRRGRYVEFNLIHDRGTLFGLKTNGRVESILMSLPPRVRWDYNVNFDAHTPEGQLIDVLKHPRNWVD